MKELLTSAFWWDALIQFAVAMAATISFSVTFRIPRRHYLPCGVTGALAWLFYLIGVGPLGLSAPLATLVASLPLTLCARYFAIRKRAPVTVFLLCGIFPLVPGAGIYYTAYYFLQDDRQLFASRGVETIKVALALALGIALVGSLPLPNPAGLKPKQK